MDEKQEVKFDTENDLTVIVNHGKEVLVKEDCCTCVTILLNNQGKIMTSFLGGHNPYIISELEKAQKVYFKSLKKALKADYNCECECGCGHHHDECDGYCECDDDKCECGADCKCGEEHHCGDEKCHNKDCNCTPEHHCGCFDGEPCKCGKSKTKKSKQK